MKTTKYGILLPSGKLARVEKSNAYDDLDVYTLTDSPHDPEFLVDDPETLVAVLFETVSDYNTDEDHPSWGKFEREDLKAVMVETEVTITERPDIKSIPNIKTIEIHDMPPTVARLHVPTIPRDSIIRYLWVLVEGSLEEMLPLVGTRAGFGQIRLKRNIIAALPTPEEYVPVAEDHIAKLTARKKPVSSGHCLLICTPVND